MSGLSSGSSPRPQQGLATIGSHSGNTLIVYAAAAGKLADDGTGQRNSPFTHSMLKHMSTPDLEVEVMLKRVTKDVRALTNRRQSPERLSRLAEEFYFNRPVKKLAAFVPRPAYIAGFQRGKNESFGAGSNLPALRELP